MSHIDVLGFVIVANGTNLSRHGIRFLSAGTVAKFIIKNSLLFYCSIALFLPGTTDE